MLYVWSAQLDLPRRCSCPGERHRCGCPFGAGLSVSENLNCPNIRYEFSLLHWPHFTCPAVDGAGSSNVGGASCSSALQRTISLKSAQISYFVLTVPSYPDQVPVTPIKLECACIPRGLLCERNLTVKRHLLKLETTRENKLSLL